MSGSAMPTTKSEARTLKTFASLRFRGDRLDPGRVTAILGAAPTTAYRKGEIFKRSRGHEARGRTGVWLLSSNGHVSSPELDRHLRFLLAILFPDEIRRADQTPARSDARGAVASRCELLLARAVRGVSPGYRRGCAHGACVHAGRIRDGFPYRLIPLFVRRDQICQRAHGYGRRLVCSASALRDAV